MPHRDPFTGQMTDVDLPPAPDPRKALLEAFDGLDAKGRVQVILAAVESGLITADQALPAFAGLWETPRINIGGKGG